MSNNLKIFARELSKYFLVLVFGLAISYLIRSGVNNYINYIPNNNPFGFEIDSISLFFIFVVSISFWIYRFYQNILINKYKPLFGNGLIIVGILGNSFEKLIWGNVADYIPFIMSTINHFDVVIWLGLILSIALY